MYKITVKSYGKYNNVRLGARYCFCKKTAKELIVLFLESKCDITVEKLIRVTSDIFVWSDCEESDKVLNFYADTLWEMEEKEV